MKQERSAKYCTRYPTEKNRNFKAEYAKCSMNEITISPNTIKLHINHQKVTIVELPEIWFPTITYEHSRFILK